MTKLLEQTPFGRLGYHDPHDLGGDQYRFAFENRYGASVVRFTIGGGAGSYGASAGLWELAVLYNEHPENGVDPHDFTLTYNTEITNNVIGHLTEEDVAVLLDRIEALGQSRITNKETA